MLPKNRCRILRRVPAFKGEGRKRRPKLRSGRLEEMKVKTRIKAGPGGGGEGGFPAF
jgi:hypothetical protein